MGDVINVRTRKHEEPPKKIPIIWLLIIGLLVVGIIIIAGVIYMVR